MKVCEAICGLENLEFIKETIEGIVALRIQD
jgi:hypothetical protein